MTVRRRAAAGGAARWLLRLAFGAGLLASSGCAGNGPPPQTSTSSFDTVQQTIFNTKCATGSCHVSGANAGNLILEEGRSYAQLVGVTPTNQAAAAAGYKRVVPFDTANSFLLLKVNGPNAAFGARMPVGFAALSPAEVATIQQWIAEGAPGPSGPQLPSPTASVTPAPTDSPTPTSTPSPSPSMTVTQTPSITATGTLPPSGTPTPTPTSTRTATATASPSVTATATFDPESTLARLQETIFTPTCALSFCHDSVTRAGNLDLSAGATYADLVGVAPDNVAARDRGLLRVDAGKPDNSFLITKVTMTAYDIDLGSPMPFAGTPLSSVEVERLRAWILRGAPQTE